MILTKEILKQGMSSRGSWSEAQINCFGIAMRNNKGWKSQIINKDFPPEAIEEFLSLRDEHLKPSQVREYEKFLSKLWTSIVYSWLDSFSKTRNQ